MRKLVVTTLTSNFRKAVELQTSSLPKVQAGCVLVKNRYVGINASDVNFTAGKYFSDLPPPFDAGFEALSEVVDVGEGVSKDLVGKPIAHMTFGAFSEYQMLPSKTLLPLPELNPEYLPLLVSGMTAKLALDHCAELKPGEKVLVTAAAGGTGQFAVQLAKLAGCHVIGTCSTDEKCRFLESLGCDHAINTSTEDLNSTLKKHYPEGVDVVYESVGGDVYNTCVNRLAVKGRLIVIGYISGYQSPMGVGSTKSARSAAALPVKLLTKSAAVRGFFLFHYAKQMKPAMVQLARLLQEGKIKSRVDMGQAVTPGGFCSIESVSEAVDYLYSRKSVGKIIVDLATNANPKL